MKINPWIFAVLPLFVACTDDNEPTPTNNPVSFSSGVVISNEGAFQGGNGTLSHYNPLTGAVTNEIFNAANSRPLGNVVNSIHVGSSYAYVVVNNGGVVEVTSKTTFESEATIAGLSSPRYAQEISSSSVAVTSWGNNTVDFYNPTTEASLGSVTVGNGPETMLLEGNLLYVANCGGFGLDSTVTVIDVTTMTAVDTLHVGYNPHSMAIDANGDLWVLCTGYTDWNNASNSLDGSIHKVDLSAGAVTTSIDFASSQRPVCLEVSNDGQTLYYIDNSYAGKPYSMSISATTAPLTSIHPGFQLYSMSYDAVHNALYFADAKDYASAGALYRYDLGNSSVDTMEVGIIPGCIDFL